MNKTEKMISLENSVCAHNYFPLPVVLTKAKGVWAFDVEGNKYLDMMSAYSAVSHGHVHPRLYKTLCEQAAQLSISSRAFYSDTLGPFLQKLCSISKMARALPMNTGAEAVETAIKAARRWGYQIKKIPDNQAEIIVAKNNFHGRTTTIISFSSEEAYKSGFGPLTPGFREVDFGDSVALERAITPNTCAFLIEPMQGEAGINIPPVGYLKACEEICRKHNVLLLVDEIQTGLGRTGKWFGFEHEGVEPDGIIIGKALGGGIYPVSAFLSRVEVMDVFTPGSHGSTFGGNPLASAIGLCALEVIEQENLVENSRILGDYFLAQLKIIQSPWIKAVRGKGLWIGVEIDTNKISAREVCLDLLKVGILSKEAHDTVIRFAPPLVIDKATVDWALVGIRQVFSIS